MSDVPPPAAPPPPAPQPPAAAPQPPAAGPRAGNGFGIASLVLGIVTMVGFAIPFFNYVGIATGIAGLALGIIGLVIKFRPRGAAIAGVILSGLGLLLSVILVIVYASAFAGAAKALRDVPVETTSPSATATANAGDPLVVAYSVTSDAQTAQSITYSTLTGGKVGTEQATGAAVPFSKELDLQRGGAFDIQSFSLAAQAAQTASTISCTITVNGKQVSTQTSTGAFAVVTCSATGSDLGK